MPAITLLIQRSDIDAIIVSLWRNGEITAEQEGQIARAACEWWISAEREKPWERK